MTNNFHLQIANMSDMELEIEFKRQLPLILQYLERDITPDPDV